MTINQLEYFLQIIKYGSFSQAAKSLYLSQPALSQQIKALEEELGSKLFNRIGNKLVLTEAGKILEKTAINALSCINAGKEKLIYFQQGFSGTLSVGICRNSSIEYVPNWLRQFSEIHPNSKFFIYNEEIEPLLNKMSKNDVDIIFTHNLPKETELSKQINYMHIMNDRILAVCPKGAFPEDKKSISLKDFDNKKLILRHNLEKNILERCHQLGVKPIAKCLCDDIVTTLMLVSQGMGYGLVPESCSYLLNMLQLSTYEIQELKVDKRCYVLYPKEELNPIIKSLLKIILKENFQDKEYN